jgi:hypothetical protein
MIAAEVFDPLIAEVNELFPCILRFADLMSKCIKH